MANTISSPTQPVTPTNPTNVGQSNIAISPVDSVPKPQVQPTTIIVDSSGLAQLSSLLSQSTKPYITTIETRDSATSVPSVLSQSKMLMGGGGGASASSNDDIKKAVVKTDNSKKILVVALAILVGVVFVLPKK